MVCPPAWSFGPSKDKRWIAAALCSPIGLFLLVLALAAIVLLKASHSTVTVSSLAGPSAVTAVLAGLNIIYTKWRPRPMIGCLTSCLLPVTGSAFAAGFVALVGLRVNAPLIDAELANADAVAHVNTPAIVAWFADHPVVSHLLDVAYISALPLVFACIVYLAMARDEVRARELALAFVGCITTCACLSAVVPAEGAFAFYGTPLEITARLPAGSGLFHMPTFTAYRTGSVSTIDLRDLGGLVTFPSFHACMALMVAHAVRDRCRLSRVAWGWACVVLVSTIPIGGHYAADVVAGASLWSAFALAGTRKARQQAVAPGTCPGATRRL